MELEQMDKPRLIEHAFPLKQASLDSVHEKNVRHGHISTLHIWPARRPLAACRAALIATLLPDPGTPEKRKELCEKIGGKVVQKIEKKKMPNGQTVERVKEETEGGILHWKREAENAETLEWFRQEIKKAYGGRAPRVLDPFAGGGAIPLEAMRLGCEAAAVDINPVAWFILKCTLEYPQKLAGQMHPLPDFVLEDEEFMTAFYKAHPELVGKTKRTKKQAQEFRNDLFLNTKSDSGQAPEADLAWHVRAWGKWVLDRARRNLAKFYPTYADFEPLKPGKAYEKQPMRLVPLKDDGTADIEALNAESTEEYLADKKNPRWVAKPTVAYLWARTVTCKNCRATVPLLRTRWLCKKDGKRVLLNLQPNVEKSAVVFSIEKDVPSRGGNAAQKREHDKLLGEATMSRSGARCVCCGTINTTEDIQQAGMTGRLEEQLIALVLERSGSKDFRVADFADVKAYESAAGALPTLWAQDTVGRLVETIDSRRPSPNSRGLSGLTRYGILTFDQVFNRRQQCSFYVLTSLVRELSSLLEERGIDVTWRYAIADFLALSIDKVCDYNSSFCTWHINRQTIGHTFARYALPMTSDYAESNPIGLVTGGFHSAVVWTALSLEHLLRATRGPVQVQFGSATSQAVDQADVVLTDPPYYDSIPYADISDFFYIWLKRTVGDRYPSVFGSDVVDRSEEIIQHAGRMDGDNAAAKRHYEAGMARAFSICARQLVDSGRLVVVFAHKEPDAWETLASSIIQAGFTVDASWPIQTEMPNKAAGGARLASSVWLVCKKRSVSARPGWDNKVMEEMRGNIREKLREFWDAGVRGPDFVWAATGPALEAYSKHPVVKKANDAGKTMEVGEFLSHVRRMVVDFVVGQVLTGAGAGADLAAADRLDEPTAYYLLHRHDFGLGEAPAGACILYAISCGVSDKELSDTWDLIGFTKGKSADEAEDEEADADAEADPDAEEDSGSKVKLKTWAQRKGRSLGYEGPGGKPIPLIDRIHCLMHLWKAGDLSKVDEYLDGNGLRRQELFKRLLQSLIELSPHGSEERSLLESLSNHVGARGAVTDDRQAELAVESEEP
jgi:adenine-specific DNA methylase